MTVQLYKDGDRMQIMTDESDEGDFVSAFACLLEAMIDEGSYDGDWHFQFFHWLPQFVDVCCAYRGYKTKVISKTVFWAGDGTPPYDPVAQIDSHKRVSVPPAGERMGEEPLNTKGKGKGNGHQ